MGFSKSNTAGVSLRTKLGLFILVLILGFAIFDVGLLKALYGQLKYTHIQESQLNQIRQLLLNIFIVKMLWLLVLSGIAIVFGFWIIKPYKDKLAEKRRADRTPEDRKPDAS